MQMFGVSWTAKHAAATCSHGGGHERQDTTSQYTAMFGTEGFPFSMSSAVLSSYPPIRKVLMICAAY